ncbi:MAG: hypothetical protein RLZZ167_684 [Pseudomonadota bacterium]|jgi:hypothetical protein|uniref:DUF3108 domain-containing protein n=1 Tax=Candidatus Fonsibacter lacus TaxID=2576439 RepID=A0A845SEF1_9PROT|nr:hypothetical protein [Pseudomonadota bacterium]NBY89720.1 hypothetical protein [Candidatus Fonsibacter lacus]NCU52818.1 hypothetical protein [Candidatus Fonsibacter lacus]NCU62945.1 hypothetical protein [Candidatus Fonsibacter lacus]NDC43642.1 hypothetical protein [Pseudomonadota bacterium]
MFRFFLVFIFIIFYSLNLNAHIDHNKNLNKIEFDIYRNNEKVGYHKVTFSNKNGFKEVSTDVYFDIKLLGVSIYKYHSLGKEIYKDHKLIEFKSTTKDGNDKDYCNITMSKSGEYNFDGTTEGKFFKYSSKKDFSLGTWWNHDVLINNNFVLGQSCRSTETKITFLNKEEKLINNKKQIVQFFNVKGEGIDVKIGFTDNTLQWVSMDFSLKGEWNYQLKNLN